MATLVEYFPKGEKSCFRGVREDDLKPGAVIYKRRCKVFTASVRGTWIFDRFETDVFSRFVYTGRRDVMGGVHYEFDIIPLGFNRRKRSEWKNLMSIEKDYSLVPSNEFLVFEGLRVPDELKYEVFGYLNRVFRWQE